MEHPRLAWLPELQGTLTLAVGDQVTFSIAEHVDPLKKLVTLSFSHEIGKGNWNPIQVICHSFAKSNDCVIEKILKERKKLVMYVLIKRRNGPAMNVNPLG